jgi:hypothetical protein
MLPVPRFCSPFFERIFFERARVVSGTLRCLIVWLLNLVAFGLVGWADDTKNLDGLGTKVSTASISTPRTDLFLSGVYPHLTTYGVYSQAGAHDKPGHNECGIGAVVPWAGKLWMVNYAPHMPRGSEHKLYSVDPDLRQPLNMYPQSVGGTPAGRMIHAESNQLLIGPYLIDASGNIRVITPANMPIRITAIARHLIDPANLVYYIDMEGSVWEANVHTLEVKQLFKKPIPGWHGKGGYTSQGRLVISNNGELHVGNYGDLLVGGEAKTEEERGVLAEFDGEAWSIVERRQYTEVTGPSGISGGSDRNDPLWAIGWDRRSLRLKVLDSGVWHTFLLPKAAYCNDASHGWYTEWPRIREITDGRWMMDMHGMFFDFPRSFSANRSAGIRPIGSHLRYVPDFCHWKGRLVLASDETSIQGNELAGQPQSNLWFGCYEDLREWGPASGYGGPWLEDEVKAETWSPPFLLAGFDRRVLHLAVGRKRRSNPPAFRATDQQRISSMPDQLTPLPRVTIPRGDWHAPAPGFSFTIDQPVIVYLAVDRRGQPQLPADWKRTELTISWGKGFQDDVFARRFEPGTIFIPGNATEHTPGSFGMPHAAFIDSLGTDPVHVEPNGTASAVVPDSSDRSEDPAKAPDVKFLVQIDRQGDGSWTDLESVIVPSDSYVPHYFPEQMEAVWMRLKTDRDCVATAFLHQTASSFPDGESDASQALFGGLAGVTDDAAIGALVYAAKRNRNLRVITHDDRFFDFSKDEFEFRSETSDEELKQLLHVEPEFQVDEASVLITSQGQRFRLPKGHAAFDRPFASGWPRALREVESERLLANLHGTFYEVPLITNGAPPAWNRMRPVSSHAKQITDYCSWNGLLVLAGIRPNVVDDPHVFFDPQQRVGLWFGGVDDLWKLGKPVGEGGPWFRTEVESNVPSDPFLMTGFDRKTASMSHQSNETVKFNLQVDIEGSGLWVDYGTFAVEPGETVNHAFPTDFSACWIRAISDRPTIASLTLQYR